MPPRVRMRCTSATIDATQRMLKSRLRGPFLAGLQFADVALDRRLPETRVEALMAYSFASPGIVMLGWVR